MTEPFSTIFNRFNLEQNGWSKLINSCAVVLIYEEYTEPLKWHIGRIVKVTTDKKGIVRYVKVHKVAVLPIEEWSDGLIKAQQGGVC